MAAIDLDFPQTLMARERIVSGETPPPIDEQFSWSLRPQNLDEYIGQRELVEKMRISLEAAKKRDEPLEHILLHGPPGLGKTTLAHIIASEMGSNLAVTSGPTLERAGDLLGILTNLERGDVLFIDEIHRLGKTVEEYLYPALEDFKVDFVVDKGTFAKTINVPLKSFTLIGATTRAGMLSEPLRNRFGITHHLDFYNIDDLTHIVQRAARLLKTPTDAEAAQEVARRSRGTPRVAGSLFRRVRDYADVKADGHVTLEIAKSALDMWGVDELGLDDLDRRYLSVIITVYNGGPVGIEAIAATLSEEPDTLIDMVEPFLLKIGFVARTKSGRKATLPAYHHLNRPGGPGPTIPQHTLF